jgi:hypothetical protein
MSLAQAVGDNRFKKTAVNGGNGKKIEEKLHCFFARLRYH